MSGVCDLLYFTYKFNKIELGFWMSISDKDSTNDDDFND